MKRRYEHPEWEIEDLEYTDIICGSVEGVIGDPGIDDDEPIE